MSATDCYRKIQWPLHLNRESLVGPVRLALKRLVRPAVGWRNHVKCRFVIRPFHSKFRDSRSRKRERKKRKRSEKRSVHLRVTTTTPATTFYARTGMIHVWSSTAVQEPVCSILSRPFEYWSQNCTKSYATLLDEASNVQSLIQPARTSCPCRMTGPWARIVP